MSADYSIYVVPDKTTDGGNCYLAYHPELQGCMSHGETVQAAIEGLHAARELYLNTLRELGQPFPAAPKNPMLVMWQNQFRAPHVSGAQVSHIVLPKTELTPVQ